RSITIKPKGFSKMAFIHSPRPRAKMDRVVPQEGQGRPVMFLNRHMPGPFSPSQTYPARQATVNKEYSLFRDKALQYLQHLFHVFFPGGALDHEPVNNGPDAKTSAGEEFTHANADIPYE